MIPTLEQEEILNAVLKPGDIMKVSAFAGTGKSTTLLMLAKANPGKKFLYIVFNRSVREEAEKKFPKNVHCRTSHSLAWTKFGSIFKSKEKLEEGNWKPKTIQTIFGIEKPYIAKYAIDTVACFTSSNDSEIRLRKHVPQIAFTNSVADEVFACANKLWDRAINPDDKTITATHNVYLKLWQLSKPRLNYDIVMLDEAQDTTDCVLDVVMKQKMAAKIFIGDTHQQLYQWNFSLDCMDKIDPTPGLDLSLTESFRFGKELAKDASEFLKTTKGESKTLTGIGGTKGTNKTAHLSRTISGLFLTAIESESKRLYFVGGLSNYPFRPILDVYNFSAGNKNAIFDPYLAMFGSYSEFCQYAEEIDDRESLMKIKIVNRYKASLPSLYRQIEMRTETNQDKAEMILSTVHRAKGLEWDNVVLGDDFAVILDQKSINGKQISVSPKLYLGEEANIIYVAMTRGRGNVEYHDDLSLFFTQYAYGKREILPPKQSST